MLAPQQDCNARTRSNTARSKSQQLCVMSEQIVPAVESARDTVSLSDVSEARKSATHEIVLCESCEVPPKKKN
jgi:hypothetical protein